jgi:hypothetical protein
MSFHYKVRLLNKRTVRNLLEKLLGVGSERKVIALEASRIKQDWTHLSISVGLPLRFVCV